MYTRTAPAGGSRFALFLRLFWLLCVLNTKLLQYTRAVAVAILGATKWNLMTVRLALRNRPAERSKSAPIMRFATQPRAGRKALVLDTITEVGSANEVAESDVFRDNPLLRGHNIDRFQSVSVQTNPTFQELGAVASVNLSNAARASPADLYLFSQQPEIIAPHRMLPVSGNLP